MFSTIYHTLLVNPIFNLLALLFEFTKSLGFSIILLTLIIKLISFPAMLPSLKSLKKQQNLQPLIENIKKKYKYDKKKQAELQMQLLKEHGINPASGCYTMIITILIFTALYSVISQITKMVDISQLNSYLYFDFIKFNSIEELSTKFLYLNLSKPDPYYILAILSGFFQFIATKMTLPYIETGLNAAKKTPDKSDDFAYNMQQQSLYITPVMFAMLGISLPSGVTLYIVTSTIFSIIQTYLMNGWGGLTPFIKKITKK